MVQQDEVVAVLKKTIAGSDVSMSILHGTETEHTALISLFLKNQYLP